MIYLKQIIIFTDMKVMLYTCIILMTFCSIAKPPKKVKLPITNCIEEANYAQSDEYKNYIDQLCKENFKQIDTNTISVYNQKTEDIISPSFGSAEDGKEQLIKFFVLNMNYPYKAKECDTQGKVYVQFIVDIDGTIKNATIIKELLGFGLEEEVINLFKKMPNWNPAKLNGKIVPCYYIFPVTFKLA
ncbi:MAG: energy transducer TonB [Chitinophagales bacterium]|nr:energy transducer TonB [Chitinophagales bacterium]